MTTEIHYEVRDMREVDWLAYPCPYVLCGIPPDVAFLPEGAGRNYEFTRVAAEALAQVHGGTVHRITTTTEPVGLRWVSDGLYAWRLFDGSGQMAALHFDEDTDDWLVLGWNHAGGVRPRFGSCAEAKVAAENAVKASWT
jgi:hypothetical protein